MPGRAKRCGGSGCGKPIVFFRSPHTGNVRAFDAAARDGRDPGPDAYPVMGRSAYKLPVLVELIQVQRECSATEAETEVRDMPWHSIHDCVGTPPTSSTTHTDTDPVDQPEKEATHP